MTAFSFTRSSRTDEKEDGTKNKKASRRTYRTEHPTWSNGWADENIDNAAFFRSFGTASGNQFSFFFGNFPGNVCGDFDDVFKGFFENDSSSFMENPFNDPFFGMHSGRNTFSFEDVFSDIPSFGGRARNASFAKKKSKTARDMEDMWDDWSQPAFKEKHNDFMFRSNKEASGM